ncbi:hypothetical protein ACFFQW_39955 [Umezawaea endophytica]|uniref:Uncharacterized protein n=1 Tax=Umezawaea endophytica TaxID=1654476 RepID=A0A9X2VQ90_9PSEU|nr:hypothetical protein [Umezawaea endophytica]MCS7479468.1 hypothetical protein [Umezawaea endophytica]
MSPREDEVASRAHLLPEEEAAGGSADPEAQAEAVLRESEERGDALLPLADGEQGPRPEDPDDREHRRSEETT